MVRVESSPEYGELRVRCHVVAREPFPVLSRYLKTSSIAPFVSSSIRSRIFADSSGFLGLCSLAPQLLPPSLFSRTETSQWVLDILKSALHECDPVWLEAKSKKQSSMSMYDGFRTLHIETCVL